MGCFVCVQELHKNPHELPVMIMCLDFMGIQKGYRAMLKFLTCAIIQPNWTIDDDDDDDDEEDEEEEDEKVGLTWGQVGPCCHDTDKTSQEYEDSSSFEYNLTCAGRGHLVRARDVRAGPAAGVRIVPGRVRHHGQPRPLDL
jgi:hypothetical protein